MNLVKTAQLSRGEINDMQNGKHINIRNMICCSWVALKAILLPLPAQFISQAKLLVRVACSIRRVISSGFVPPMSDKWRS